MASIDGIDRLRFYHEPSKSNLLTILLTCIVTRLSWSDFVHLPVQAGSDRILTMMKRGHTALEYKSIIRKLRAVRPNIQISSDFIVGFPGETNEEFEQTMNLIAQVNFDMSFSFIYSARPGTPAADMPDDVTEEEKKQRLYLLQETYYQTSGTI